MKAQWNLRGSHAPPPWLGALDRCPLYSTLVTPLGNGHMYSLYTDVLVGRDSCSRWSLISTMDRPNVCIPAETLCRGGGPSFEDNWLPPSEYQVFTSLRYGCAEAKDKHIALWSASVASGVSAQCCILFLPWHLDTTSSNH